MVSTATSTPSHCFWNNASAFNSLITFLQSHEFFSTLDAAVMPFIIVRVRMDSYVHCSLTLEHVATPSHLQFSGIKIVCTMAALYFLQPLNSSLLPFTFSCSHSTSPFLCQTLGMLHEQIFSIFYTSPVSCLLLFLSVCFIHFASVWMCALSILYSEHVCKVQLILYIVFWTYLYITCDFISIISTKC